MILYLAQDYEVGWFFYVKHLQVVWGSPKNMKSTVVPIVGRNVANFKTLKISITVNSVQEERGTPAATTANHCQKLEDCQKGVR